MQIVYFILFYGCVFESAYLAESSSQKARRDIRRKINIYGTIGISEEIFPHIVVAILLAFLFVLRILDITISFGWKEKCPQKYKIKLYMNERRNFCSENKSLLNVFLEIPMECARIQSAKLGDKSLLLSNFKAENIAKRKFKERCPGNWMIINYIFDFSHCDSVQPEIQFQWVKSKTDWNAEGIRWGKFVIHGCIATAKVSMSMF